jgi:hypothetical protein
MFRALIARSAVLLAPRRVATKAVAKAAKKAPTAKKALKPAKIATKTKALAAPAKKAVVAKKAAVKKAPAKNNMPVARNKLAKKTVALKKPSKIMTKKAASQRGAVVAAAAVANVDSLVKDVIDVATATEESNFFETLTTPKPFHVEFLEVLDTADHEALAAAPAEAEQLSAAAEEEVPESLEVAAEAGALPPLLDDVFAAVESAAPPVQASAAFQPDSATSVSPATMTTQSNFAPEIVEAFTIAGL